MKAPMPMPTPFWLLPVEPAAPHADPSVWPAIMAGVATVAILIAIVYIVCRFWPVVVSKINREDPMSAKLDALAASVASLESAVTAGVADIGHAAQLFKDNAAASVQLEADEAVIAALTARVDAAASALNGADADLKAPTNPAPAPSV